jgi:hypothetical protein
VFADAGDNVIGQHLSTRDHLGYAVTDTSEPLSTKRSRASAAPSTAYWCVRGGAGTRYWTNRNSGLVGSTSSTRRAESSIRRIKGA